jgi:hypothetical protein
LPRLAIIPDLLTLETLTGVRTLVDKHLPAEYRSKFNWRHLAGMTHLPGQHSLATPHERCVQIIARIKGKRWPDLSIGPHRQKYSSVYAGDG